MVDEMLRKKTLKLDRRSFLSLKPKKSLSIEWREYDSGEVVITWTREDKSILRKTVNVLLMKPKVRKTILDDPRAVFVWKKLDGKTTIEEIIREFAKKFNFTPREAELSVTAFLSMLSKRRLIEVEVPESKQIRGG
ncbi:MAG: hypothetical protein DRN96_04385 [Thermoproteota archaeon]|nr:MAG: hypothetical protein DRN96_04385 [Candidatus Korarchaeota archaeon]RLG54465.1 MAG: hypothetical protein DRN99_05035 [Candidatus Korarchaeota archaeon]